jgi:aminopeptidase N
MRRHLLSASGTEPHSSTRAAARHATLSATLSMTAALLATGCTPRDVPAPDPGVALALADARAAAVDDLRYDVALTLPAARTEPVTGTVSVRFNLKAAGEPLVLDFRAPADHVYGVLLDGDSVAYTVPADHIVIPAEAVTTGEHTVTVRFRSTDAALNRQDDFLYALFVPDRASTALPVFEQPNLKARYTLTLTIPAEWKAVANGAMRSRDSSDAAQHVVRFAESQPISTYLFSFAAGVMQTETAERNGRTFTMYHRETDAAKVARNREAIFDLHATAITWLEEYTQIPYPFDKFDFFAVPSFQFGGMEHPGAIWYRAGSLFLDPTASRSQELGRASLIAHETAHMWFGDLVTMRWFNDVWMKEVFANFMAAKIAGPAFPDLNLRLRFFQAHLPTAYGVDRTAGANPIRQPLENLRDAGSLYGAIIYQKAPVVMQQLETLVGDTVFRDGLRTYLDRHRYGNATWPDLIGILDSLSPEDLTTWSRAWVEEPGRPRITARWADSGIVVTQSDDNVARNLRWNQPITLAVGTESAVALHRVQLREQSAFLPLTLAQAPRFILPGADGVGYGRFVLDGASREALRTGVHEITDPIVRSVAWQALWEEVLDDSLGTRAFLDEAIAAIPREQDELIAQQVMGLARGAFWQFLPAAERSAVAPAFEAALWQALEAAPTPGRKGAYFGTITGVTLTPEGVARLERIWRKTETPRGLPLAEQQYINLAEALALRGVPNAEAILDEQATRITNPDRVARFAYMRPALSADVARRDSLFRTFSDVENRRRESWVLGAQGAMHHPLRASESLSSVRASLDLVEEIQATGDIFFPLSWLNATLGGHQSPEAAAMVRAFLEENPNLPPRLRGKVLQAADDLFRASIRD